MPENLVANRQMTDFGLGGVSTNKRSAVRHGKLQHENDGHVEESCSTQGGVHGKGKYCDGEESKK